jgi:enoyl-CoA hydratase/carnithine racemase
MGAPTLSINGACATLILQRPEQANRLEPDDLAVICDHIDAVNANTDVRVLRLKATGRHFCSGYDIGRIGTRVDHGAARVTPFDEMVNRLEDARPVTIAVLQGGVYGGATDLALACDFRLGTAAVDMFMPAARLGLHFYRRGLERYVSRLGLDQAKRLFLTAERVGAEEMKAIGFLTELIPADDLLARADALTATLCGHAPLAVLGMKKHLNRIARDVLDADELQHDINRTLQSNDLQEGGAAWTAKRAPHFKGH